jgi:glycosyltransferase involved in cell wall biosynthesis
VTAKNTVRRTQARLRTLLGRQSPAAAATSLPAALAELARTGPVPLSGRTPATDAPLRIATIIPSFRRGSGGHMTIVNLMRELQALGHEITLWLEDCEGRHIRESASVTRESFAEFFGWEGPPLQTDLSGWSGADVVLATGWQTVARALLLPEVAARAYLVQDHEPDFYPASAERLFAEETYRQGLHCIAASKWLADLLRTRYGASASHFDLAVDHSIYHPSKARRRDDLVVFYARAVTPRRAVPLGLLALAELARKRPDLEIALFGEDRPLQAPFDHTNLGVLPAHELAAVYGRATIGMVFSLTNPSLIGLEMMACGLACVELASESMSATFGNHGPLLLVEPRVQALCDAVEHLFASSAIRASVADAGIALTTRRTWARAGEQVQRGLSIPLEAIG